MTTCVEDKNRLSADSDQSILRCQTRAHNIDNDRREGEEEDKARDPPVPFPKREHAHRREC